MPTMASLELSSWTQGPSWTPPSLSPGRRGILALDAWGTTFTPNDATPQTPGDAQNRYRSSCYSSHSFGESEYTKNIPTAACASVSHPPQPSGILSAECAAIFLFPTSVVTLESGPCRLASVRSLPTVSHFQLVALSVPSTRSHHPRSLGMPQDRYTRSSSIHALSCFLATISLPDYAADDASLSRRGALPLRGYYPFKPAAFRRA
ncbi:hypothetical protein C8R47DRAFT_138012 [Mycena vitilis]|nr:hypothetical protein C8R47DRAFT_138012 [Mycena vitilis]